MADIELERTYEPVTNPAREVSALAHNEVKARVYATLAGTPELADFQSWTAQASDPTLGAKFLLEEKTIRLVPTRFESPSKSSGTSGKFAARGSATALGFVQTLSWLDEFQPRQEMFDWVVRRTDEILSEGNFDQLNDVFKREEAAMLSASAITALLRSTFMARNRLPSRQTFKAKRNVVDCLRAARSDADEMLRTL